jgi:Flp pilus assembly protein TadG
MVVLLVFVVLALDVGYICLTRRQMQNAADAAALSGAAKLQGYFDKTAQQARKAAKEYAAFNHSAGEEVEVENGDITLGVWNEEQGIFTPLSGAAESNANAVQVKCVRSNERGNPLHLCFGAIIGSEISDVAATATARVLKSRCGLIIGLERVTMSGSSHTDSYNAESGSYDAATAGVKGHVCSNGDISMSGSATIHGDAHPGPSNAVKTSGSASVVGVTKQLAEPMRYDPADPGDAKTHNDNGTIPLSDLGKEPVNSNSEFTLSGGDGVSLEPGTYYFSKMSLSGGSTVRISGLTIIYVENNCSLSGGSLTNLTSIPKNLQLFPMGEKCVISGSSQMYGVVYAPYTKVERSGSADYFGAIVAGTLVLSGEGAIHADESLDLSILSQGPARSILVE